MGQTTRRPSVWCSKYYYFFIISCTILCKKPFNIFFYNFAKIKNKSFECPKSIRNYEKKIILGKSDAWSMSRLVHLPSDPAYYIEDCQILRLLWQLCPLSPYWYAESYNWFVLGPGLDVFPFFDHHLALRTGQSYVISYVEGRGNRFSPRRLFY